MTQVTAREIQALRHRAGVGMMDAKTALVDAGGDPEKAMELLRERGQAKMAKRSDREATEGSIGSYIHIQNDRPVIGALVELTCETDFVAKSSEFRQAADDIAMHISWADPRWITRDQVDADTLAKERDLIARQVDKEDKPPEVIGRIVDGKMEAWYAENVLYDQSFVNTEKFEGTVADLIASLAARMGEKISVRRVSRLAVGG